MLSSAFTVASRAGSRYLECIPAHCSTLQKGAISVICVNIVQTRPPSITGPIKRTENAVRHKPLPMPDISASKSALPAATYNKGASFDARARWGSVPTTLSR